MVYEAYKAVKSNRGASGVDEQSIEQIEADLSKNLYKIWNRMSSGSCFPPPVRAVSIPKKSGGERILGVPAVADRVAQTVVKQAIEPIMTPIFLADSYGCRPNKSALDAIGVTRKGCWKYDWVVEFDIKGLFDNVDHELLLRAVRKHITCRRELLYMVQEDGTTIERNRGTRQGGVVSPISANRFMHYTFDLWMARTHPELPWCRYADDGLVHCRTQHKAEAHKAQLQARLAGCHLEMHPTKTKIVYCRDGNRTGKNSNVKFDFLGYCFRPRLVRRFRDNVLTCGFNPAVSPSALYPLLRYVNQKLVAWVMHKFKRLKGHKIHRPASFSYDWSRSARFSSFTGKSGWSVRLPDGSRVRRESHARFYERLAVQFRRPTHPNAILLRV
jgi:RNA-directed DNA polymerase